MSCFKMSKNKDNTNQNQNVDKPNKVAEIIENIEKKSVDKILNDIYKEKINAIVTDIKKIADSDPDPNKSANVKAAEACFKMLGQETHALCPHGLQFFQCMPCSH